jgi:hypothetical protein
LVWRTLPNCAPLLSCLWRCACNWVDGSELIFARFSGLFHQHNDNGACGSQVTKRTTVFCCRITVILHPWIDYSVLAFMV